MNQYDNEGFEIVKQTDELLSNYNDIPDIADHAGMMDPSEFQPRDPSPFPTGQQGEDDDE